MTSYISHTSVDCAHAYEQSEWWKQVLGYVDVADDPNEPGHVECMILSPENGHTLLFIEVPEAKEVKNRVHFDLRPAGGRTREQELERLVGLGATEVHDLRTPDGRGWVVLTDPEGNEFCVLRSVEQAEAARREDGS